MPTHNNLLLNDWLADETWPAAEATWLAPSVRPSAKRLMGLVVDLLIITAMNNVMRRGELQQNDADVNDLTFKSRGAGIGEQGSGIRDRGSGVRGRRSEVGGRRARGVKKPFSSVGTRT